METVNGYATAAGTKEYAGRHEDLAYRAFGDGLLVSEAGFGCYRVDVSLDEHRGALRKALLHGINVIDTSANYSDGGSEELVGAVLREMIAAGELRREEVVVVSKVGYLQGQNYQRSQERKQAGRPFPDLVLYGEGLEHCIHPEFLEDQLTRSLERLGMATLDCYLLHNPEYFLGWAKKAGVPLDEARVEYERRIELAFRHLEAEVERGRIRGYGISSNTFPASADDPQFTSLERVWEIAQSIVPEPHFQVIQLPMNLYETGGVTVRNNGEQSAIEFAREKGLAVMINRPLNAFKGNALYRLADVAVGAEDRERAEKIPALVAELVRLEGEFQLKEAEYEKVAAGRLLQEFGQQFQSLDHWREVLSQFLVPTVQQGVQMLMQRGVTVESYVEHVNAAIQSFTSLYRLRDAEKTAEIKRRVTAAEPEWESPTLSQTALRALRSTAGVTTVLVGMRREEYVDDVVTELKREVVVKDRLQSWQTCTS